MAPSKGGIVEIPNKQTLLIIVAVFVSLLPGGSSSSAPVILEQPSDTVVARGEPATLNCKVSGDPSPRVEWWRESMEGKDIATLVRTAREDPSSHRILLPNSGLFFLRAEQGRRIEDSGIYWCRAENSVGTVTSRKATLQVSFLDQEFRGLPSDLEVALGSSVVLPCQAPRGAPTPLVTWFRGGKLVVEGPHRKIKDGSLLLSNVTKEEVGDYVCRAENPAAVRETPSIHLGVHVPAHLKVEPPASLEATVGEDSLLRCQVAGDPAPTTRWSRPDGGKIAWGRARLLEGRGLLLQNIHPSDEGTYRCQAENKAGAAEGEVEVRVVAAPVLTVSPAPHLEVEEGGEVRLSCLATGRPAPTLVWAKEGVRSVLLPGMSADNVQVTAGGSLLIRDPVRENSGVYTCSAINRVGGTIARSVLRVGRGIAENLGDEVIRARDQLREPLLHLERIETMGNDMLEVHFSLLAHPPCLQGVLVHYKPSSERYSQYTAVKADLSGRTILSDLKAATQYNVFVQPFCGVVGGLPTIISTAITDEEEGVGETIVLVAEMINSTTAFVAWQPSTKRGITGYEVELKNNDSSFSTQVSSGVSELYLGLNPADLQQDYTVRVAILAPSQRGQFSPPAKLSLPLGLPVSVQPGLAEAEDTAWLLLLLGSLALLLLLVASLLFYYRRRRKEEKRGGGYLPAAVTDLDCRPGPDCLLWSGSDSGGDSSTASQKGLLRPTISPYYRGASSRSASSTNSQKHNGKVPLSSSRSMQSPYATTDLLHHHHHHHSSRTSPLVELAVRPLLRNSVQHRQRCRESRSSDNLRDSIADESPYYAGVHRRRSNPNLLDMLPPPPVTAPPPEVQSEEVWEREGRREVERALQEERRRRLERTPERGGRRGEIVDRILHDERRDDGQREVERALEEELTCFHETVTQFHRF